MTFLRRRRWLSTVLIAVPVVILAGVVIYVQFLDPGNKNDVTSDLVTPAFSAQGARVFEVSAAESQVDFVVQVQGLNLDGVFPVQSGTITLEPVGSELRVVVRLNIDVNAVSTGSPPVDDVLRSRSVMATGDYPVAFYVAASRGLVPVTEEEITFVLDGDLELHNVVYEHDMAVRAQLVGQNMWAVATSDLDMANHGIQFPSFFGDTTIQLTARLHAYEGEVSDITGSP
ncbi:MAG: YceI family protein [Anaerolineae bacterium]|nr:YceI family protein [Anaerolineae bacterium]